MTNIHTIPRPQRAALSRLERTAEPVHIDARTGEPMRLRGLVTEPRMGHYVLSEKGRKLIDAMNDPTLTQAQVYSIYR